MNTQATVTQVLCSLSDLVPYSGVAAKVGLHQIALFYVPHLEPKVYAIDNVDPFSGASILARGLVGDYQGKLSVASPLYKHHFDLQTGTCFEQAEQSVKVWPVMLEGNNVVLQHV